MQTSASTSGGEYRENQQTRYPSGHPARLSTTRVSHSSPTKLTHKPGHKANITHQARSRRRGAGGSWGGGPARGHALHDGTCRSPTKERVAGVRRRRMGVRDSRDGEQQTTSSTSGAGNGEIDGENPSPGSEIATHLLTAATPRARTRARAQGHLTPIHQVRVPVPMTPRHRAP